MVAISKVTVCDVYAILVSMYRLLSLLLFLLSAQNLNIGEEVQQNGDVYQKEIRIEELCPRVCNSIEEFLFMPLYLIDLQILSCGDPWNSFTSLIYSWR